RRLAELVRVLYEQGEVDPLSVLLGSESLDQAFTGLDGLDRAAQENIRVADQAKAARRQLLELDARLTARGRELARVTASAEARARELDAAAADRRGAVAALRRERDLTARQVDSLGAQARAAQQRTATVQATATASVAAAPTASATTAPLAPTPTKAPSAPAAGQMTVEAVGYSLPGHTASGLPVGHGIVAVDPSVIPLGTRLYVPGYGVAVAADTGGAVRGAMIDLWFPTTAAALNWGRRTVVITIR
ncbi:MAG: 3D domain-containing protein, partial [Actinobacteria bacterium]|nr:3D domain-containing protein [Actinomycetota bacterium]